MQRGYPVCINVYDLHEANGYVHFLGLGAYHTGVEVAGREYAYAGHPGTSSGVYDIEPRSQVGARFREQILVGECRMSARDVSHAIMEVEQDFPGNAYSPVNRNCNTFTNALCLKLIGKEAPSWINRLAYLGSCMQWALPTAGSGAAPDTATPQQPKFMAFSGVGQALSGATPTAISGSASGSSYPAPENLEARRAKIAQAALKRLGESQATIEAQPDRPVTL
eukprot:TRINITY_DN18895_c0_g1_i1.p1 TRINITY_DN18895_c0_g1~~TRINITY_DN18895_c0_g1_i1.p1  ORF type:complete len:245 (+),score=32.29 TRINITY_DN18895_c0_g1_i1:69-737(+)